MAGAGVAARACNIGIDEAGYAPLLGPLVVTGVRLDLPAGGDPTTVMKRTSDGRDIYDRLARAVTRVPPGRGDPPAGGETPRRIHVADSKVVYSPSTGLAKLERGALAFLELAVLRLAAVKLAAKGVPPGEGPGVSGTDLTDLGLVKSLCRDGPDLSGLDWYAGAPGRLPLEAEADDVAGAAALLAGAYEEAGFGGLVIIPCVVTARELNRAIAAGANKAEFLLGVVADLMASLMRFPGGGATGPADATILVDRLGGRKYYTPLLERAFPGARVRADFERARESCYSVEGFPGDGPGNGGRPGGGGTRRWRASVAFACEAESRCLTVALASMVSKYVRELFMRRMNRYFRARLPRLRPTAGYPEDAARFLAETAELRAREGVADELFIRAR